MTKSQSDKSFQTSANQNATAAGNAQSSYQAAQQDVGDYQSQLAKFAASNPFTQGGEFQTAQDQSLASTAAAGSQQAQQMAQGAGVRSGMNPATAIAAGEQASEANTRNQLQSVANANTARIGDEAGYNQDVVKAAAMPEQMEAGLTSAQLGAQDSTLSDEQRASQTPSFWQELGQGVISAGGSFAGGFGEGQGRASGCWIAAKLYGSWEAREVALIRLWLTHEYSRGRFGKLVAAAYERWGESIAESWMPRSRTLTALLRELFYHAHLAALRWTSEGRGLQVLKAYDALVVRHRQEYRRNPSRAYLRGFVSAAGEGK